MRQPLRLLILLLLLPVLVRAQYPDSAKHTTPNVHNLTFNSLYSTGGNTSNAQVGYYDITTEKWNGLATAYQLFLTNQNSVENYRAPGLTDDQVIQAALNAGGKGSTVYLGQNKTYLLTNTIFVDSLQTLIGKNSIIRRAPQTTTTLTATASQSSNMITVSSIPAGWKVGDFVQLYTDSTWSKSTVLGINISAISGNIITLNRTVNASGDGTITTWPVGSVVRKIYYLVESKIDGYLYSQPYILKNITFDGNKANNRGNYYWYANGMILMGGFQGAVQNCKFYNVPNENIIGHGFHIENCYAENLNGSFIHMSGDLTENSNQKKNAWIENNYSNNTNIMSNNTVNGHDQGVINLSFQGGWVSVVNNRFYNGGESVLGLFGSDDGDPQTQGENKIIFTGNLAENFKRIIYDFSANFNNTPKRNNITGNLFYNCGINDWGIYATTFGIGFTGNKLMGGTTVTSISAPMINSDSTSLLIDGTSIKLVKDLSALGSDVITRDAGTGQIGKLNYPPENSSNRTASQSSSSTNYPNWAGITNYAYPLTGNPSSFISGSYTGFDSRYLRLTGGTLSGNLTISGGTGSNSLGGSAYIDLASPTNQALFQLNGSNGIDLWFNNGSWSKQITLGADGDITATAFITNGGTSSQYVKGDGTLGTYSGFSPATAYNWTADQTMATGHGWYYYNVGGTFSGKISAIRGLTANRRWYWPDASGTLLTDSANNNMVGINTINIASITGALAINSGALFTIQGSSGSGSSINNDASGVTNGLTNNYTWGNKGGMYAVTTGTLTNGAPAVFNSSGQLVSGVTSNFTVVNSKTANYAATTTDHFIPVDATSGAVTITLPTGPSIFFANGSQNVGITYIVKKTDSSVNTVTIAGTIDGGTNSILAVQNASITVQANSTTTYLKQ